MNDKVYAEQIKRIKRQYFINPNLSDEEVIREMGRTKSILAKLPPKNSRFRVHSSIFFYPFLLLLAYSSFWALLLAHDELSEIAIAAIALSPLFIYAVFGLKNKKDYIISESLIATGIYFAIQLFFYLLTDGSYTLVRIWRWHTLLLITVWHIPVIATILLLKRYDRLEISQDRYKEYTTNQSIKSPPIETTDEDNEEDYKPLAIFLVIVAALIILALSQAAQM